MTHYLSDLLVRDRPRWQEGERLDPVRVVEGPMNKEKWNDLVNGFDAATFARQIAETGAGYHIITVGQTSGYYISPNASFDEIVGRDGGTSWFPQRDLIKDIGNELKKYGVRLVVYIPIEEPRRGDQEASRILRPKGQIAADGHTISAEQAGRIFADNWVHVLEEYALRWGDSVDAWWFDGCWEGKLSYPDDTNWDTIIRTLRKGNPDVLVSFNHQYRNLRNQGPPREDFFAGETNNPQASIALSAYREDGAYSQMLTYLGYTWYFGNRPRFDIETAQQITRNMTRYGGTITWDIAIHKDGTLVESYLPTLKAINKAARENPLALWRDKTGGRLLPEGNVAYQKPAYLMSSQNRRGHHDLFAKLLPARQDKATAANGNDGDVSTAAQADGELNWAYTVDLLGEQLLGRVKVVFGERAFPANFAVDVSVDGLRWRTIHKVEDRAERAATTQADVHLESAVRANWVRVRALEAGEADQQEPMAVAELQVYAQ
ncbi:MAG: discoidin domain-containing protein [Porticoccaceae bacterium]|nr:discoidin domain-containing protein [Porticoccaceae bacterium]